MRALPLALATATAVLTACGAPMPSPPSSSSPAGSPSRSPASSSRASPSVAEASTRVEQHVRDVAAHIPGAALQVQYPLELRPCTEPVAGGPPGQVTAGVVYRITGLASERNAAAFDVARRYWSDQGFRVLLDARPGHRYLHVEAPEPDFTTISLQESGDDTHILFLIADSPCLLPDGTLP
ncbi:MAG: hypothetical protein H0X35_02365 [Pseudonocardiales bacterium]|nr:hypothetical protein [Pseudonocardiales bacterium]